MTRFLKYFGSVVLVVFLIAECSSFLLLWGLRKSDFFKQNVATHYKGEKFDFIILGSSRGLTSIDTKLLGQGLKQHGFNFSVDDTHLGSQVVMLKHLLANDIKIDTLFLVHDAPTSYKRISTNDYRFFSYISQPYVQDYFKTHESPFDFIAANYFPFLALGYYNVELLIPSIYSLVNPKHRHNFDSVGDFSYPAHSFDAAKIKNRVVRKIDLGSDELNEIIKLCSLNSIQLIIVVMPAYQTDFNITNPKNLVVHKIGGGDWDSSYFYDQQHLNGQGKKRCTEQLIEQLHK